jgi:hypothetical protein
VPELYLDHYTRHNGRSPRLSRGAGTLALLSGKSLAVLSNKLPPDPADSGGGGHRPVFHGHPGAAKASPLKPAPITSWP